MTHPARTRREYRRIGAPLVLQLELCSLEAFTQLVVANTDCTLDRPVIRILLEIRFLLLSILSELIRRSRIVTVAIDNHAGSCNRGSARVVVFKRE